MIGEFRDIRTQLLIVAGVLLAVDVGSVALLLSPVGHVSAARQQVYEQLRLEKIEKAHAVAPVQGMDQKIATARQQEAQFSGDRLAQRYSAMSEQLSKIAGEANVRVSEVKYDSREEKDVPPGFDSVGITIQVHGTYEQNMRFINAIERQKMMLMVDAVSFGGMQADELTFSVHLSTFLRSAA